MFQVKKMKNYLANVQTFLENVRKLRDVLPAQTSLAISCTMPRKIFTEDSDKCDRIVLHVQAMKNVRVHNYPRCFVDIYYYME